MQAATAEAPKPVSPPIDQPEGLQEFVPWLNQRFTKPEHLSPLTVALERSWYEPIRRTAHAPPRHGKTDTVLAFIAKTLKKQPHRTIAYVSYGDRIAKSKSRRAQAWARAAGVRLATDALNEWRTVEGGGLIATGIGGPLTSQGVDILLVDDPYKSRIQAESAAYRSMVADWWGDVAETRLEPGAAAFIFHTRWHTDDLIGHVLNGEDSAAWQHINMPAISADGHALWPGRWPLEALLQKQRSAGPYTWYSLYQGEPRKRGGTVFGDVHFYTGAPTAFRVAVGVDLAYSAKTKSDWSVAVVLAAGFDVASGKEKYFVLEVLRKQVKAPEFEEHLKVLKDRYPGAGWRYYASGTEQGAADFMTRDGVYLGEMNAGADKFIRSQPVAAAWNRGEILVPQGAAWANELVTEVKDFTGLKDPQDDQVDALAAAYDQLAEFSGDMFSGVKSPQRRI